MADTCFHCGEWTGRSIGFEPKHREGCPLRKEPPVPQETRLSERLFMDWYIENVSLAAIAGKPERRG